MNREEAQIKLLINLLKRPDHGNYASYGYDIFLPNLIHTYILKRKNRSCDLNVIDREWEN